LGENFTQDGIDGLGIGGRKYPEEKDLTYFRRIFYRNNWGLLLLKPIPIYGEKET